MTIRQILLVLRSQHGSFDNMSKFYGVDRDYLYRLYNGERKNPTTEFLAKLGVVVDYKFK